jgi:aryl-alcohol dehydrogenase-like predicted oxidoreductase
MKSCSRPSSAYCTQQGNHNAGGNGRKNRLRALEALLWRLRTDYIDLYIMHTWDRVTAVEEVVSTLNDLVRCGFAEKLGKVWVPGRCNAGVNESRLWYFAHASVAIRALPVVKMCIANLSPE